MERLTYDERRAIELEEADIDSDAKQEAALLADGAAPGSCCRPSGNARAVLVTAIAGLGPLLFGYSLGFTSPAQLPMEVGLGVSGSWAHEAVFRAEAEAGGVVSAQAPLFGAAVNIGAMVGALLAGPLADRAGRRLAIAASAVPWLVGWAAIGLSSSFGGVLVGRVLTGVAVGIASMAVPLFISEISPTAIRGALGAANQLAAHPCRKQAGPDTGVARRHR